MIARWLVVLALVSVPYGGIAAETTPAKPESKAPAKSVPAKGKPSLTAYYTKGFTDAAWQRAAFDKVAKIWVAAAPPAPGKKAVVISTLARDGKIVEARVTTTSGSDAWDQAAVDAVRKAAPFPTLPTAWPVSSLEVHWHFQIAK